RLPDAAGSASALVRFPEQLVSLGLEVLEPPEQCLIVGVTVREIGRMQALARAILSRAATGSIAGTLAVLRREGLRGAKIRLALPFWPLPVSGEPGERAPAARGEDASSPHGGGRGPGTVRATHVMSLDGGGTVGLDRGRYRAIEGHCRFDLLSSVGRCPTGWVRLRYRVATDHGPLVLRLRVELRDGTVAKYDLPPASGAVSALLRLPDEVSTLRLVPAPIPEHFTIDGFTVREIRKREVLARTAALHVLAAARRPHRLPTVLREIREVWRREGPMGLKRRLASPALPKAVVQPLVPAPSHTAQGPVELPYRPLI